MICKEHQVANPLRSQVALSPQIEAIDEQLGVEPDNHTLWMERGLALAGMRLMREAVEAFSKAISLEPFCGILYRHRAHRHLSCWEFQEACADFVLASRLIPDNWDVWYHLGLSHYLLGEYEKAEKAYKTCYELSSQGDKRIPVSNWYWATLMRQGKWEDAQRVIDAIGPDMDCGTDEQAYYNILKLHKGLLTADEIENEDSGTSNKITQLYGVSNYYYLKGDLDNSNRVIERVLLLGDEEWWPAFGYLASMVDKKARRKA